VVNLPSIKTSYIIYIIINNIIKKKKKEKKKRGDGCEEWLTTPIVRRGRLEVLLFPHERGQRAGV
jgi:hypothetical protein